MSHEKDIYDSLVAQYPGHVKSITDLSFNPTGNKNFIGSAVTGFDFDLVFNLSPGYTTFHNEKSPDALFLVNDKLFFVEFKEGGHKKIDIRSKIHEGVITLFMYTQRYLPVITKSAFCALDINYAVVARETVQHSSFQEALKATSEKYQLKNMEGFLIQKTFYAVDKVKIAQLLKALTQGAVTHIDYYESPGSAVTQVSA